MIRTRGTVEGDSVTVFGSGPHILAMNDQELQLMGALLGLIKMGFTPYKQAAAKLLETLEEASNDPDFCINCLNVIEPQIQIYDDDYALIQTYDSDTTIEIIV